MIIKKFGTKYCGDCRRLSMMLKKININFEEIEINEKIAKELNIQTIPVLIKYENDKEIGRMFGLSNLNAIKNFCEVEK